MEYRTKAAVKIIAGLTKKEAFELFDLIGAVEKKFKQSKLRTNSIKREDAVMFIGETIDGWVNDGELEVPLHLSGSLMDFIRLMVSERAQEDELLFEYNRALCPLLQYDLFKADA